jgi:hypothetical protein
MQLVMEATVILLKTDRRGMQQFLAMSLLPVSLLLMPECPTDSSSKTAAQQES